MLRRIFRPNNAITGADMAAECLIPNRTSRAPRRLVGPGGRLSVLALALLASGCSGGSMGSDVSRLWSPFMGPSNVVASDSLTVQRVRGGNPDIEPLVPESGDVWPAPEAARAAIGGPDDAMRNIPVYRPSLIEGAPAASSPVPTPGDTPRRYRGSSTPPPSLGAPADFARSPASPRPPGAASPPAARLEGRTLTSPSGQAVTGTGGTSRVQGYTGPQGGGAVIRDGNVETWIGPNGQASTRVVPN